MGIGRDPRDIAAEEGVMEQGDYVPDGTIKTADLGAKQVTLAKLADGVLAASATGLLKMADGYLAASAGGLAKMADGFLAASVGARAKMADRFLTLLKFPLVTRGSVIVGGAADAPAELAALTTGQILVGNGTDLVSVAVSGDITLAADGTTAIGASKVTGAMLLNILAQTVIAGGAAGDHTVTGIATDDHIVAVWRLNRDAAVVATIEITDITSEFTITGADTINNAAGTDTTGDSLMILYINHA